MPKKLTTEEWIERAKTRHGDRYDYSKSVYTGSKDKITITCKEHGDFEVLAQMHVTRGDGCPRCSSIAKGGKLRLTNEEFISRLYSIFGDKYDYSKVEYTGRRGYVTLVCPKHGEFNAVVNTLLKGVGCLKCGKEEKFKETTDSLVQKFKEYHPELDFSKTIYTGWDSLVTITCPKHGDFQVLPNNFLKYKGCPKCSYEEHAEFMRKSFDDFLKDAKYVHGEKYDYSKVDYVDIQTKICIICPEHGEFWQTPASHIQGSGCPACSGSKGERTICDILLGKGVKFIQEYTISIPQDINISGHAYVDFYLPEYNAIIEYNGIQHYEPRMAFGGSFKFEQQQARDNYVRQYCKNNNIRLIEIRYDEDVWIALHEKLFTNNVTNNK